MADSVTDDELRDLEALRAKATPGPWKACGSERGGCKCCHVTSADAPVATATHGKWGDDYPSLRFVAGSAGSLLPQVEPYMEQLTYGEIEPGVGEANAVLIAAAVNALPRLIEAVREARAQATEAIAARDRFMMDAAQLADEKDLLQEDTDAEYERLRADRDRLAAELAAEREAIIRMADEHEARIVELERMRAVVEAVRRFATTETGTTHSREYTALHDALAALDGAPDADTLDDVARELALATVSGQLGEIDWRRGARFVLEWERQALVAAVKCECSACGDGEWPQRLTTYWDHGYMPCQAADATWDRIATIDAMLGEKHE